MESHYLSPTRLAAPGAETATMEEEYRVLTVHNLPITTQKLEQFKVEVNADTVLQKLSETVKQGWPERKSMVDPVIREYWSIKDEINVQDQFLLRWERLIVPATLRTEMLQKIHENHLGIEKCKRRARDILYWPGMNDQIAQMVARCEVCLTFRKSQQKEPMKGHQIPDDPWKKVGIDLFQLDKENYVVISDYYSKFFEISKLTSTSASSTIKHIKPHVARYGIPEEVISDNGPQFASAEDFEFKHTTSSPRYPQSNELAERTVQTIKSILKKSLQDKSDPNLALLDLLDLA